MDEFTRQVSKWYQDLKDGAIISEELILEWLENNRDVANFIADFGEQIIITILVLNVLEDIATFGGGAADN